MNKSDFFTADAVKPHFTYDDYCESADMIASHSAISVPRYCWCSAAAWAFSETASRRAPA